jgi:hypothetical protein
MADNLNRSPNFGDPRAPQFSGVTQAEDVRTATLNQVSWEAVFAGATIALVLQLILNMLGLGIGVFTVNTVAGDSQSASSLSFGAVVWWVVSGIVASGIGGYIAGRLSGKPSASTTAYHGLVSWALATLVLIYLLSSVATGLFGGGLSTVSAAVGGAGKAIAGTAQSIQVVAPSLNPSLNMSDAMSRLENQMRSASGGQDPSALRDTAIAIVKAAASGDPVHQAAATDGAAESLAKAQNIPVEQAKSQVGEYQKQYRESVVKATQQAKETADATAKTISQGALFGTLALLLGALAAFFCGQVGAVEPTVTRGVYPSRPA